MQDFKKNTMKKHLLIYFAIISLLFTSSCKKDFDVINKNPNGFTSASDGSLFNATISSLKFGWNEQLYVNQSVLYKETQQVALPYVRWTNYTLGTEEIWSNYYTTLPNIRELEKRFSALDTTSHEVKNMMCMVKILMAYKTFKVTDLFGDVPFFNAGYGFQDFNALHPSFDSQETIYKFLLNELNWAANNIDVAADDNEPFKTFEKFDNLFFGDLGKWKKFANSLSLRYAMRMVNREPVLAGQIIRDIIEKNKPTFGVTNFGQLIENANESAMLFPYQLGYRNESKGWAYNQSEHVRMGNLMWQYMSANDSTDGSGIFDPRAFYLFEPNNDNDWVAYPVSTQTGMQPDGGAPYDYQRDNFYTVKGANCKYSPVNYYLARDMDYVPDVLITGAEVLFLRAEAYQRGIGVNKDLGLASTAFLDGLQFSLNFWETIMQNSRLPSGISFSTNVTVPPSVNFFSLQSNIEYFTASEQDQLKEIYRQSWIDLFRQPQEVFALSRRTGLLPHIGNPSMINRFPIPPSEVSYNQANWLNTFGTSGDNLSGRVWWMN
jgi:Starch-binding associating with outer membrane